MGGQIQQQQCQQQPWYPPRNTFKPYNYYQCQPQNAAPSNVICVRCKQLITESEYVASPQYGNFHTNCFSCARCGNVIQGTKFRAGTQGEILCINCSTVACAGCGQAIQAEVTMA